MDDRLCALMSHSRRSRDFSGCFHQTLITLMRILLHHLSKALTSDTIILEIGMSTKESGAVNIHILGLLFLG